MVEIKIRRYRWSDGQNNRKRDIGFNKNGVGYLGSPALPITNVFLLLYIKLFIVHLYKEP